LLPGKVVPALAADRAVQIGVASAEGSVDFVGHLEDLSFVAVQAEKPLLLCHWSFLSTCDEK
jgi:hypothetical protein